MTTHTTPPSLAARIAGLPDLPMSEIKVLWRKLFGDDHPTHNRQFLERRIAYRLQEIEFRKTNRQLVDRNHRRIEALIKNGRLKTRDRTYRPPAGTLLTRQYGGAEHQVLVTPDEQYEYQGRLYPSLSMIAREITGDRWSGPLFFGLRERSKPATKKGSAR